MAVRPLIATRLRNLRALVITTDAFFTGMTERLAKLATRYAVPTIFQCPEFTAAGGLLSYDGGVNESYRLHREVTRLFATENPCERSGAQKGFNAACIFLEPHLGMWVTVLLLLLLNNFRSFCAYFRKG
jgi:hypothetical protein